MCNSCSPESWRPLAKVPLRLLASRSTTVPSGLSTISACNRDTDVSPGPTGRSSHSLPRPIRNRSPAASKLSPLRASMRVIRTGSAGGGGGGGGEGAGSSPPAGASGGPAAWVAAARSGGGPGETSPPRPSIGMVGADGRTSRGPSITVGATFRFTRASTRNRGPWRPRRNMAPPGRGSRAPATRRRPFR